MNLPDHLSTKVNYHDDVVVVNDDRNPGESDADFAARHGRHIQAIIALLGLVVIALETLTVTTTKKEDETDQECIARHISALLA
jgi:hypothetical protein